MTEKRMARSLARAERRALTAGVGINSPFCLYMVVAVCVITDYYTCLAFFEAILTQNHFISVLLALVTSIILDAISIPFTRALKRYLKTRQPIYKIEMTVAAATFTFTYLLTVLLKVTGARALFHTNDLRITGLAAAAQAETPLTADQIAMVAFLAVFPLATTFFAGVMSFRTVSTRVYRLKAQLHKVKLDIAVCDGRIAQIRQALDAPLEKRDKDALQNQIDCLRAALKVGQIDAYSTFILSGAAKTPEEIDLARAYAEKIAAGAAPVTLDFTAAGPRQAN